MKSQPPTASHSQQALMEINAVVHRVLILGLGLSTALMLFGLALELIQHGKLPDAMVPLDQIFTQFAALQPAAFLSLGLLTLIATPILRVIGSIIGFVYERDWRYALVTLAVLLVVILSIFIGRG